MFGVILKATNSSFQRGMTFCRSIYVKKIMKLLAFIFEHRILYASKNATLSYIYALLSFLSNKKQKYMVGLSRQCLFGDDRPVQISRAVLLIKGHNPNFDKKCKVALVISISELYAWLFWNQTF